ncbi:hypothetical protein F2Q69_00005454 [Brassica cretica]|uniref:Uncharacterized protein n=1 Tax=Brassica cretica TaxID=69181 RepID=A0A8S9P972_BRACR|nr:hypothetical protein F2Q69_00005454 [Brassica cretica]
MEFVVACGGSWLRETTKKMKRPRFEIGLAAVNGSDVTTPLGTKRARAQRRDEPAREIHHQRSSITTACHSWVLEYHMENLETLGCIWSSKEVIRVIFGRALPGATSPERLSQVTPARATYRSDAMNSLTLYASERPPRATRRSRSSS